MFLAFTSFVEHHTAAILVVSVVIAMGVLVSSIFRDWKE